MGQWAPWGPCFNMSLTKQSMGPVGPLGPVGPKASPSKIQIMTHIQTLRTCRIPKADVEMGGSPCPDYSMANIQLFLTWASIVLDNNTPVAIHENVMGSS